VRKLGVEPAAVRGNPVWPVVLYSPVNYSFFPDCRGKRVNFIHFRSQCTTPQLLKSPYSQVSAPFVEKIHN